MSTREKKPLLLPALLRMKCPSCRKGFVFKNNSIFPLGQTVALKDNCPHCGQQLKSESNNGGGINYALTVIVFFLNLTWCWPLFHITYTDNSIYYYLAASTTVVVLMQPLLMRISRMIYLYLYINYSTAMRSSKDDESK